VTRVNGPRSNAGIGRELIGISASTTAQTIANNTVTKVTFSTVDHQIGSINPAASELVVVLPGVYLITGGLIWDTAAGAGRRQTFAETYTGADPGVGAGNRISTSEAYAGTVYGGQVVTKTLLLVAGSHVRLCAFQTTGANLNIANVFGPAYLTAVKVG